MKHYNSINLPQYDHNLLITQQYCQMRIKKGYKGVVKPLRSFNPIINGKTLFTIDEGRYYVKTQWSTDLLDNSELYENIFNLQLEYKRSLLDLTDQGSHFEGRIMIAEIDVTEVNYEAEIASHGFIDGHDCPPIDTWFYLHRDRRNLRRLYAWIPKNFEYYANNGIDANGLWCIGWKHQMEEKWLQDEE